MQININGRGAFLGAFAAIALAALTAAQLPSLQARSAGGGYMGLMNPGREIWRFTGQEQADANAGYTVPAGKELVICGVGAPPVFAGLGTTSGASTAGAVHLWVDAEPIAGGFVSSGTSLPSGSTSWFPGIVVPEGRTLRLVRYGAPPLSWDSLAGEANAFAYGYLRDL